jgi:two-component system, NarL family, nitrate/nitrite response regulator NarL
VEASTTACGPGTLLGDAHEASQVEELLRLLVDQAADSKPAPELGSDENAEGQREVVLALSVDGVQYTLVRTADRREVSHSTLSPREREICRLIARGLPNKAIAAVLDVSLWTVATHLRRVFAKLGVSSRAEMVARAMEEGLLGNSD